MTSIEIVIKADHCVIGTKKGAASSKTKGYLGLEGMGEGENFILGHVGDKSVKFFSRSNSHSVVQPTKH